MFTNFNDCSIAKIQMSRFIINYQLLWSITNNYISKILNNNYIRIKRFG